MWLMIANAYIYGRPNIKLEQVKQTKFLGVIIHFSLSWEDYIKTVSNRVSKNIRLLYKIRGYLCGIKLLMLNRTVIQSYYEYCNIDSVVESSTYLHHLYRSKKGSPNYNWNAHAKPLFLRLKHLIVYDTNKLQVYCFVHKALNGHLLKQFCNWFTLNNEIHSHNIRQVSDIHVIPRSTKPAQTVSGLLALSLGI